MVGSYSRPGVVVVRPNSTLIEYTELRLVVGSYSRPGVVIVRPNSTLTEYTELR